MKGECVIFLPLYSNRRVSYFGIHWSEHKAVFCACPKIETQNQSIRYPKKTPNGSILNTSTKTHSEHKPELTFAVLVIDVFVGIVQIL